MKHLRVDKPCSENWNEMTPTQKGAFCHSCKKQVIDFSNQSKDEIKTTLLTNTGQEVCGRIEVQQLEALNMEFDAWRTNNSWSIQRASFYAFLFVFGLAIVSCSDQMDAHKIEQVQEKAMQIIHKQEEQQQRIEGEAIPSLIDMPREPEPYICEAPLFIEEIEVTEQRIDHVDERYITMGMMVSSPRFIDYIEQTQLVEDPLVEPARDANGVLIPTSFDALAFPNPTQGRSTLKFEVPSKTEATISVFNMQGKMVLPIASGPYEPGTYELPFDLTDQLPGMYLVTILSADFKKTLRVSKL